MALSRWFLPIRLMVLFLAMMAIGATFFWNEGSLAGWLLSAANLCLLALGNQLAQWALGKIGHPLASPWEHRAISTLILFLLFDSLTPWWAFPFIGFLTRGFEQVLRLPSGPFFNPAALGSIVAAILGFLPTWWGTNFGPRFPFFEGGMSLAALLTIAGAGYIASRYKKLPLVASGLVAFSLSYFFLFESNPIPIALEGTLLFFLLVMAAEPKTSPNLRQEQLLYGGLIGLLIPIFLAFGFIEAYLGALLLGNLYHRRLAVRLGFQRQHRHQAKPLEP